MVVAYVDCFVLRSFRLTLIRGWMAPDETLAERLWRVSMYGWPPSMAQYAKCAYFCTHMVLFWLRPLLQIVRCVSSVCIVALLGWCTVHAVNAAAHSSLVTSSINWSQQSVSILVSCCQQHLSPLQAVLWSPARTHWFWGALCVVNLCSSLKTGCVWGLAHAGFTLMVPEPTLQVTVQLVWLCWSVWALLHEVSPGCNIKLVRGIIMLVTTFGCVVLVVCDLLFSAHPVVLVLAHGLACVGGLSCVMLHAFDFLDACRHWCLPTTRSVLQQAWAIVRTWCCNIKLMRGFIMLVTTYGCVVLVVIDLLFSAHPVVLVLANWLACVGGLSCAVLHSFDMLGACRHWCLPTTRFFFNLMTFAWGVIVRLPAWLAAWFAESLLLFAMLMALLLCVAKQPHAMISLAWALRTIVALCMVAVYVIGTFVRVSTH